MSLFVLLDSRVHTLLLAFDAMCLLAQVLLAGDRTAEESLYLRPPFRSLKCRAGWLPPYHEVRIVISQRSVLFCEVD